MDTKAAFEKWWKEESGQADICAGSNIGSTIKMIAFDAWTASREAIEIDLDNVGYMQVEEGTFYLDEGSVEAVLTSHGIRIKGKTK